MLLPDLLAELARAEPNADWTPVTHEGVQCGEVRRLPGEWAARRGDLDLGRHATLEQAVRALTNAP